MPQVKKENVDSDGERDTLDAAAGSKVASDQDSSAKQDNDNSDEDEISSLARSRTETSATKDSAENSIPLITIKQEPDLESSSPPVKSSYFARLEKLSTEVSPPKPVRRSALSSSSDDEDLDKDKEAKSNGRVKFPISVFSRPSTLTVFAGTDGTNRAKKPYQVVQRKLPKNAYRPQKGPVKKRRFIVDDDESESEAASDSDSDSSVASDISDTIAKARGDRAAKRRKIKEENGDESQEKKPKGKKKSRIRRLPDSDEEPEAEFSSSSEDDQYEDRERLDSSSSDDGEGETYKTKSKPKSASRKFTKTEEQIEFESEARRTLRARVVNFMNEASAQELTSVSSITASRASQIVKLRPFQDYQDLKNKIENCSGSGGRHFAYDMIDKVVEAVRARDDVHGLMMQCQSLSESIRTKVDLITPASQPAFLNPKCKLMDYQLVGLNWLALMFQENINAILADEMGLGKTIQVIAFLAYLKEVHKINGPHLIVVPSSTLDNWDREFSTWAPKFDLLVYHGSIDDRLELRTNIAKSKFKFEIMLTTYNLCLGKDDAKFLKNQYFQYIVFDEAHLLKNMKTIKFDKLLRLRSRRRLMLTGTPLQNNLLELLSLLIFTMPDLFLPKLNSVKKLFALNKFNSVFSPNSQASTDDYLTPFERERINHAKNMLHPFILRRIKANVLKALPEKTVIFEKVPMDKEQKKVYDQLIASYRRKASTSDTCTVVDADEVEKENEEKKSPPKDKKEKSSQRAGSAMLMNLRKAANHPLLIRSHYDEKKLTKMSELMLKEPTHHDAVARFIKEDMELLTDHELHLLCCKYKSLSKFKLPESKLLHSGKFAFFDKILPDLFASGEKVLIFSQFCITLDLVEFYMRKREYPYVRLDGSTKIHERLDLIDGFNNDNGDALNQTQSYLDELENQENGHQEEHDEEEADEDASRLSKTSRSSRSSSSNSSSKSKNIFAFLLTTKAGGVGINLTAATTAILHDIDFNPYNDKQAEDRCHRLGQTRPVTIYKLVSEGTVEEGILALADKKMKLGEDIQATREALALNNSPIKSPSKSSNRQAKMTRSKDMQNLLKRTLGIR